MKLPGIVYRRKPGSVISSGAALDSTILEAAGLRHNYPVWAFGELGIVVLCAPEWERAVSEFLADSRAGQGANATGGGNGATPRESELCGARARSAPVKTDR